MALPVKASDVGSLLERAAPLAVLEDRLAAVRRDGRGALALVAGEAGIGKSSVARELYRRAGGRRVLWGACDPLDTPRPLGPLADVADATGGELAALVGDGARAGEIVAALVRELGRRPSLLVLEDLHWADGATLDVLAVLARRIVAVPTLVLGTYRDDELGRAHPLRVVIGELPPGVARRIILEPLSPAAVEAMAQDTGLDAAAVHRHTGGNPFFVTEVVAAATPGELPPTVRDAVLARAARLPADARAVLDAIAIVPQRAEIALLAALAGGALDGLDACLASGMLRGERDTVRFRHEIARLAVEQALAPHHRVTLHRRALTALSSGPAPDLARIAHHAEGAGDAQAVLRYAPMAAERAAQLRAHREAAAHLGRALRFADHLAPDRRAELLERRAYECYLTDEIPAAVEARRQALELRRGLGDRRAEGDAHRWLSRLLWFSADNAAADEHARQAIELLEPLGPGPELAMAYSNMSHLRMLDQEVGEAVAWGTRAIQLAEELGETTALVHALNNVGTARLLAGEPQSGRALLERSLALAVGGGLEEHVARAYTNLATCLLAEREYAPAGRFLDDGIAYCREHDLDSWRLYMTGYLALRDLEQGDWSAASMHAAEVLDHPGVAAPTRITPLTVLGRLRARRGDPDVWGPLDEALRLARRTGELQRLGAVAIARAEARWLAGEDERIADETAATLELALRQRDRWVAGELAVWRRRAGADAAIDPHDVAEPAGRELAGDGEGAAALLDALGCRYDAALARAHAGAAAAQRAGLDALHELGARAAALRVARMLRSHGVRDLPAGPRTATRHNPAGLTARELEVLVLVAEGLRNAEIGERLFLSPKTVAHHVSAILRKLGVETRAQAGAEALRRRIVER